VSIVSSPHAGRLEGASDRPEFEAIRLKTELVATHCKYATYRSVTWKDLHARPLAVCEAHITLSSTDPFSDFIRGRQPIVEMNERRQDFELLQRFVRQGEQSAFADVARRHLDLVLGTALRKVEDSGAAQEIAQNVFGALARKAWRFAPDDSLPAWLHKTTLLESKSWLRGELRRRRREETAAELGTTMHTPDDQPAFNALVPLLDEALLSLRETDRTALLLRYYESHSLRDVGAAFGVSEDTAQKRVQSALEKLSRFFQRRGFRTASVAATAAALKATGASASTGTLTAVVNAALHAAPPVLTGLAATVARVAALSKVQAAAVCIAIAIVPVTWQWRQAREVKREVAALQLKLDALRTQREESAGEMERLRAESTRLEGTRPGASLADAKAQEAARKLENLKARSRALLTADNYRWPDDLPFVRIPKSALPSITMAGGPISPAKLQSKVNQLLDLSPPEREAVGQVFSNYFVGIDQLLEASLYETNQPLSFKLPSGAESKVFVLQPLGQKIRAALDQLCADLSATLGEDRWAMVKPESFEFMHYEQVRLLGYTQYAWDQTQEIAVNVFANAGGEPAISWTESDGAGSSPMPLRSFLPGSSTRSIGLPQGPPVLMDRVRRWFSAEAASRLTNSETK
jgi:RNA polymerase sigma factor (sigma-70 family)